MRTLVGIALCVMLSSSVANAQIKIGAGTQSCGTWVSVSSAATELNEAFNLTKSLIRTWAQGYVFGALAIFSTLQEPDTGIAAEKFWAFMPDSPSIELFLTKYCQEHPLDNVLDASTKLYADVRDRAQKALAQQ